VTYLWPAFAAASFFASSWVRVSLIHSAAMPTRHQAAGPCQRLRRLGVNLNAQRCPRSRPGCTCRRHHLATVTVGKSQTTVRGLRDWYQGRGNLKGRSVACGPSCTLTNLKGRPDPAPVCTICWHPRSHRLARVRACVALHHAVVIMRHSSRVVASTTSVACSVCVLGLGPMLMRSFVR
jgi:hypothetical protein